MTIRFNKLKLLLGLDLTVLEGASVSKRTSPNGDLILTVQGEPNLKVVNDILRKADICPGWQSVDYPEYTDNQ